MTSLLRNVVLHYKPGWWSTSLYTIIVSTSSHQSLTPPRRPRAYQTGYLTTSPSSPRFFSSASHNLLQENSSSSSSPPRLTFSSDTILITQSGKTRLKEILSDDKDGSYLRILVEGGGCSGFQYKFEMDSAPPDTSEDIILVTEESGQSGPLVVIDKTSLDILKGSTLDYEVELIRSAFRIVNIPLAEQGCSCGASFNVKID